MGKGSTFFAVGQDNKKCGKAWIMLPATTFVVFTKDSMPFNSLPKSDKSHQFQMLKIAALFSCEKGDKVKNYFVQRKLQIMHSRLQYFLSFSHVRVAAAKFKREVFFEDHSVIDFEN